MKQKQLQCFLLLVGNSVKGMPVFSLQLQAAGEGIKVVNVKLGVPGLITIFHWELSRNICGSSFCVFPSLAFLTPILYFLIVNPALCKRPICGSHCLSTSRAYSFVPLTVLWASSSLYPWLSGKESACQYRRLGFNPWVRKIFWRRKWHSTPVFLPVKSHG